MPTNLPFVQIQTVFLLNACRLEKQGVRYTPGTHFSDDEVETELLHRARGVELAACRGLHPRTISTVPPG